ncbi:Protein of unknown function [Bacillus wiedmannii]|nr:Protein of unknown function [Bacillus wiedmannii]
MKSTWLLESVASEIVAPYIGAWIEIRCKLVMPKSGQESHLI